MFYHCLQIKMTVKIINQWTGLVNSLAYVKATFDTITETMVKGDKVSLIGFGNFEVRERAARTGKNPQTGAEIKIAACKAPAFKPGKALKDAVNK